MKLLFRFYLNKKYREVASEKHYMKGGKVGEFPAFDPAVIPGVSIIYADI